MERGDMPVAGAANGKIEVSSGEPLGGRQAREEWEQRFARESRAWRLREAWVWYLFQYPWDHACTLTHKQQASEAALADWFSRWVRQLESFGHGRVDWFWVIERGGHLSRTHIHALLANTARIPVRQLEKRWVWGTSDIRPYDDSPVAALQYVVKDMPERCVSYELSPKLASLICGDLAPPATTCLASREFV